MNSRFIDPIPEEYQLKEEDNFFSRDVIRGVHSCEMVVSNFLPSFIERPRNPRSFVEIDEGYYSMSVYRTEEECRNALQKYPRTWASVVGFAKGNTNLDKGIATKPAQDGHIHYFLYDYLNNSPCYDFQYLCNK